MSTLADARTIKAWLKPPTLVWTVLGTAAWTLVVWGNRIGLLTTTEAQNPWAIARVAGSLLTGTLLVSVGWRIRRTRELTTFDRVVLIGHCIWTAAVWVPSLISVLPGGYVLSFKLVHAVLGIVSILLAAILLWAVGRSISRTSPP